MPLIAADQVAVHRPMLVRFARQRLHNDAWAEDAVSDTLVAALESLDSYAGRASVRTWLIGILKHKVVDQIRRRTSECHVETLEDIDHEFGDLPGAELGGAREPTCEWGDPQECLRRRQFMEHLGKCLKTLPPQQARAVILRDCMEEETEFVCNELGVTANNLAVILHRARAQLRVSLQMYRTTALGDRSPQPRVAPSTTTRRFKC